MDKVAITTLLFFFLTVKYNTKYFSGRQNNVEGCLKQQHPGPRIFPLPETIDMGSTTVSVPPPSPPPANPPTAPPAPPPEQAADPPPPRSPGHHNYNYVLTLIKEQLGQPPHDYLEDIPCFRIPDLRVAIENNWVPRVQELLQKGRTGGEVSSEEMIFLRKHIGWLERQCHENALRTDKANYTMTDRKPDFFFLGNRKAECSECLSSHSHFNSMDPCFPLDHNGPQLPRDLRSGGCWKDGKKAIYIGTKNFYLHPAHQEKVLNLSIIRTDLWYGWDLKIPQNISLGISQVPPCTDSWRKEVKS